MEFLKKVFRSIIIGIIAGGATAFFAQFFFPDLINRLENVSYYTRYQWEFSDKTRSELDSITNRQFGINIVDIDDRTMQKMGVYHNWDRSYHAELINMLSSKFPAAIVLDIFFSNPEDTTHRRRLEKLIASSQEHMPSISLPPRVRQSLFASINYDQQLIDAIKNSNCTYLGLYLSDTNTYGELSRTEMRYRTTMEWHDSLQPQSALELPPDKLSQLYTKITIIDGIFPALAHAAKGIGHIMAQPGEDGILRELPLLYRFREFDPVYMPISLRTVASLFATPNNEIIFEPKKYIDIGKPFKIFRDTDSSYSFSYPNVTMAQVREICKESASIASLQAGQKLDITSQVIASRDSSGSLSLEMNIPGVIPGRITALLLKNDLKQIRNLDVQDSEALADNIYIKRDSESDWVLHAPIDPGEWYFSAADLSTLARLTESDFTFVKSGERKLVFHNFTVRNYDNHLVSSLPVLRDESLLELCTFGMNGITSIAPGFRQDFGKSVQIPLTENNNFIITFFGPSKVPFPTYSFYDIVKNRIQGQFDGKVFIVGSTAAGLFDIKAVPVDKHYPGVEIHACLMNSFFTNTFVTRLSRIQNFIILFSIGSLIGFISYMFRPLISSIITILSLFAWFLAGLTVFSDNHVWIEIARPLLTIIFSFSSVMVFRYITEERDRKFLQNTFKQYVSPELIDIMYKNRKIPILGGDEGIRSAFFTDIQGFSTFSEKLGSPTRLVELLNEYLTEMTDILLKHFGTLDKYEGDAIIAFFGAPMHMDDHAHQACFAALDMQIALGKLRTKWISEGAKWPAVVHEMRMRIGINTGLITTGNMGSVKRKNYTMMGDAVNLAARLESAAKQYGVYTMISNNTFELIKNDFETRQVDKIRVVGKTEPVTVYELIATKGALDSAYQKLLPVYNEGLSLFYAQKWNKAIEKLSEANELEPYRLIAPDNMTPSKKILHYCELYQAAPPGTDWNGVMNLTLK